MKLAAIDIGSNAVRLLVSHVYETGEWAPLVKKADLYRVPLRLGEDAFLRGEISSEKSEDLVKTMHAFKFLMQVCQAEDFMACATSALRCARNGDQLAARIERETQIKIDIVDGPREGELIALNRIERRFKKGTYLYIDVGGGSTELTLYANRQCLATASFKIGTIRIKEGLVAASDWKELKAWVKKHTADMPKLRGIGSGGNINKIFKLTRKKQTKPLKLKELKAVHRELSEMRVQERMMRMGLRPDRADVIVPAGDIYLAVMKWAGIEDIFVPQIGLSDGMIHELYHRHITQKHHS